MQFRHCKAHTWTEVDAGMGAASVESLFMPPGEEEDIRASKVEMCL